MVDIGRRRQRHASQFLSGRGVQNNQALRSGGSQPLPTDVVTKCLGCSCHFRERFLMLQMLHGQEWWQEQLCHWGILTGISGLGSWPSLLLHPTATVEAPFLILSLQRDSGGLLTE